MRVEIVGECVWVVRDYCSPAPKAVEQAEAASLEEWGGTKFLEMFNACSSIRSWVAHCPSVGIEEIHTSDVILKDYFDYYEVGTWTGVSNGELFKVSGMGTTDDLHVPDHTAHVHSLAAVGSSDTHYVRVERFEYDIDLNPGDLVLLPALFPYEVALCGSGADPSYFLRQFLMQNS